MSLCHKIKFSNPFFLATWWLKPFILQTKIIWSYTIYSLKYLRSTPWDCKDIEIRKSKFVAKTQFFCEWRNPLYLDCVKAFDFREILSKSLLFLSNEINAMFEENNCYQKEYTSISIQPAYLLCGTRAGSTTNWVL